MATRKPKAADDSTFESRVAQAAELLNSLQDEAHTQIGLYQNLINEKNVEIFDLHAKIRGIQSTLQIKVEPVAVDPVSAKQKALGEMEVHIAEAYDNLTKACRIADQWNFTFTWDLGYGMSGDYNGKDADWQSSSSQC